MWAQIFRAGPSLMFMVDMRCSSFSSSRACPSISCDRKWGACSSQPCSEEINCDTSSTPHWAGLARRQLGSEVSVGSGGGGWWQEAEEAGERDMGSSSSSSPLDSSSEWLDSEWHLTGIGLPAILALAISELVLRGTLRLAIPPSSSELES